MLMHIALMSIGAPLVATVWTVAGRSRGIRNRELWAATATQLLTLWAWHLPAAHHLAAVSAGGAVLMHLSLLIIAIWFWLCLIRLDAVQQWQGILALLITGKLACLLAGLLVFAPRPVLIGHQQASALEDQHLAGLLMLIACPASYVLAGVLTAVRAIRLTQKTQPRSP
jgi:putative membrane protein